MKKNHPAFIFGKTIVTWCYHMRYLFIFSALLVTSLFFFSFSDTPALQYDIIIRNGTVYDGSGNAPITADVAINADTIAAIGDLTEATGKKEIKAEGLVVAPGFINMLSWGDGTLLKDGRSMSDIKQGVTLEVFGEGFSPGPVKRNLSKPVDSLWTTLDGYFRYAMKKGVSCNIASFVGATSIRMHELGQANRPPSPLELKRMKSLVEEAMKDGAMGLGTSLIYAPATYASTEELIELSKVASAYGGMYITHMRSEGDFILKAMNETFRIAKESNIAAEIYHLKINIARNWPKIDTVIFKIDSAQKAGLEITANMYPYTASGTGLNSRLPTWVQEGGAKEMRKRLKNPAIRKKVLYEMEKGIPYKNSDPENVVLMHFRLDSLNALYRGKKLSEAAIIHGKSADETALDLIIRDKSRIESLYYLQSEDNVRKIVQLPYVSFGSDAGSFTITNDSSGLADHPRAFGTFARILGRYVREEKLVPMEEAIRRLSSLPAKNLKLHKRGELRTGYYADVAIFNAAAIADKATFEIPHVYAEGMIHVIVNGVPVLEHGNHTGKLPGRVIRGPGYKAR
jgi:N-acyl-D-amino-acid deacylase